MLLRVGPRLPETVKDVVFVGGDDEFGYWEAHAFGVETGKYVAEIARGNNELDCFIEGKVGIVFQELKVRVEVVGYLG